MSACMTKLSGVLCGRRYEKELETHFRDCLLFYLDGKIRFERYCYGEAAGLVFGVWARGFDEEDNILWDNVPDFEMARKVLPHRLTDVEENGNALQFDGARKRYLFTEEFSSDKANGYGTFRTLFLRRRFGKKRD